MPNNMFHFWECTAAVQFGISFSLGSRLLAYDRCHVLTQWIHCCHSFPSTHPIWPIQRHSSATLPTAICSQLPRRAGKLTGRSDSTQKQKVEARLRRGQAIGGLGAVLLHLQRSADGETSGDPPREDRLVPRESGGDVGRNVQLWNSTAGTEK